MAQTLTRRLASGAETGKSFGAERIDRGLSVRSVAKSLGISATALQRWEQSRLPVPPERAAAWHAALDVATREHGRKQQRQGFSLAELRGTGIGRALAELPLTSGLLPTVREGE